MAEPWLSAGDIYAWIAEKSTPAHKLRLLWKFQTSEVDEWVRSGGTAGGSHGWQPKAE